MGADKENAMKFKQYAYPESTGYQGWIETCEGNVWAFVDLDGNLVWDW